MLQWPPDARGRVVTSTTSDARGRFRVRGLAPGVYEVDVAKAGLGPLVRIRVAPPAAGFTAVLHRDGVLTGRVTDGSGLPAIGAEVDAHGLWVKGRWYEARTGIDGRYHLPNLPPGGYVVSVNRPGWQPSRHRRLVVAAGATQHLDLQFPGGGRTIHGIVVDADTGAPLAGVWVCLGSNSLKAALGGLPSSVRSGPDGRFRFRHVPNDVPAPGIHVLGPGSLPHDTPVPASGRVRIRMKRPSRAKGHAPSVPPHESPPPAALPPPVRDGGAITGTVRVRGVLARHWIVFARGRGRLTVTDDRGTFRLGPLAPGKVTLIAMTADGSPGDAFLLRGPVRVHPQSVTHVRIAARQGGAAVEVGISGPTIAPMALARLIPRGASDAGHPARATRACLVSLDTGQAVCRFSHVAAGAYVVRVQALPVVDGVHAVGVTAPINVGSSGVSRVHLRVRVVYID